MTLWHRIWIALALVCFGQSYDTSKTYRQPNEVFEMLMSAKANTHSPLAVAAFQEGFGLFWRRVALAGNLSKSTVSQSLSSFYNYELPEELSENCAEKFDQTLESLAGGEMWALQMFDAWGKPEAGLLTGIVNWLGDYSECVGISPPNSDIKGRYCTGIYNSMAEYNGANVTVPYQLGICLPSVCTADDAAALYNFALQLLSPSTFPGATAMCQQRVEEREWTGLAKTAFAVYGIMIALCLLAGLYDYMIHDTAMYYMVHELPIPADMYNSTSTLSVRSDRVLADDEGCLIQTQDDEHESSPAKIYVPASKGEQITLSAKRYFLFFSCYTNGYKILTATHSPGSIECIHGVRFLSLTWVILGHTLVFSMQSIASLNTLLPWITEFSFQAIINASVSVDSFFMISGLLTAYLMLKDFHSRQISLKDFAKTVPVLYLHRYIRLTPALAFMVLFMAFGLFHVSEGPMWPPGPVLDPNCQNNSWATLLYVNNIYQPGNECVAWSWYLSNDFQFFIAAPFIVGLIYWKERFGVIVCVATILISNIASAIVTVQYNLGISLLTGGVQAGPLGLVQSEWFVKYYVAPWTRYQAYGVGLFVGYVVWKCNGKLTIHWSLNLLLWLLSTALCMLPLYGVYKGQDSQYVFSLTESVFYNSFNRTSWCLGLGYLVLACHCGRGGWINDLLSWRGFIPVSRLTYCAYLMHPVVMTLLCYSLQSLTRYTKLLYAQTFLGFLFASYCVAFVFSCVFESPFLNIDKHLITGALQGKKKKNV